MKIDAEYVTATARDLVRIPSVNPAFGGAGEIAVADYVQRVLTDLGLDVVRLEGSTGRPSILGTLSGGTGPSLMLNAHYDTVGVTGMADPFAGRIADGRLYGRGAFDMKGALASCIGAVKAIRDAGVPPAGDVIVAAVADEEAASLGMIEVLRFTTPARAIVTEPTGLQVCLAHKGFVWVEYESTGRAAHGSRPDLGVDANLGLVPLLDALRAYAGQLSTRQPHPLVGAPSLHVGLLRGGTGLSTYAARSVAGVERRTLPGEALHDVLAELHALVPSGTTITIRTLLARAAFEAADGPLVQAVENACRAVLGAPPERVGQGPWMDSALLAEAGVETVVIGPSGAGAHADEEWVDVDSVVALAGILAHVGLHEGDFSID